jgi:tRNA(fMet)-specific endonuclease VapC
MYSRMCVAVAGDRNRTCGSPRESEKSPSMDARTISQRRAGLEEYLHAVVRRSFPILPYDEVAADWHGRERPRLEETGKTSPFVDGQIAAIAFTRRLTLVTANTKSFRSFEDLEAVDWT